MKEKGNYAHFFVYANSLYEYMLYANHVALYNTNTSLFSWAYNTCCEHWYNNGMLGVLIKYFHLISVYMHNWRIHNMDFFLCKVIQLENS